MGRGCGWGGGKGRGTGKGRELSSRTDAFLNSPAVDLARLFKSLVGKVLGRDSSSTNAYGRASSFERKALDEPHRANKIAEVSSNRNVVVIDRELCTACGLCLEICAQQAIRLTGTVAIVNAAKCSGCGACIEPCPNHAISPFGGKQ